MKLLNKILTVPVVAMLFVSCDPIEDIGPGFCPSDDFSLTADDLVLNVVSKSGNNFVETPVTSSNSTVDLDGEGLHITSDFSEVIEWKLSIENANASTVKEYSGQSDSIDIYWYGNSKSRPMFSDEEVKIKLTVFCFDDIVKTVEVVNSPTFKNIHPNFGVLLRDWDQNSALPVTQIGQPTFVFGGADGFSYFFGANDSVGYTNEDPSPMGGYNLYIKSTKPSLVWYYGATGLIGNDYANELAKLPTFDASKLFFHIYIKGDQTYQNTSAELVYRTAERGYLWSTHVNWEGWKFISMPLSDFKSGTIPMENAGNATDFSFQLGSQPMQSSTAQVSYDFALITVGEPLFAE